MEESSSNTTEVMVWLNSPGINRHEYHSLGYRVIDGRSWEVLYTLAHLWRYVVFAAPLATSKAVTITDHNIKLFDLIRFAADHGLVKKGAELQAVDAGFEGYEDPHGRHAGRGILADRRQVNAQLTWWRCDQFVIARSW